MACLVWFGRALVARDAAAFCVAGVAQTYSYCRFAWQAWHKLASTVVLRGRRGTNSDLPSWHKLTSTVVLRGRRGTGWRAWSGLGAPWSRVTPRHSAWQAWHLVTFTFVSRGRRGTNSDLPSFCVEAGRGTDGSLWRAWSGLGAALVAGDAAAFCVAGVALGDIHFRFAWQAWHKLTSTVVLRGRRGTDGTGWRAWSGLGAPWSRVTPRHFCVAGVAQTYSYCRFAWQAWHKLASTVVLRGRRGTNSHLPSFCVAGVGQMALAGVLGLVWARLGRA